jgi:hypothetical protein
LGLTARVGAPLELGGDATCRAPKLPIFLVVVADVLQQGDRVSVGRAVPETEDREAANRLVGVGVGERVQQRPRGVDCPGAVSRELFERDQRRASAGRALVLDAAPQELELLAVAKLSDRAVGDGADAIVRAAGGRFDLVLPATSQARQLTLLAALGQRRGLCRSFGELRQR